MHPIIAFYLASQRCPSAHFPAVECSRRHLSAADSGFSASQSDFYPYIIHPRAAGGLRIRFQHASNDPGKAPYQAAVYADMGASRGAGCRREGRGNFGASFSVRRRRVSRLTTVSRQIWVIRTAARNCLDLWPTALDLRGLEGKDRTATGTVANLSQGKNSRLVSLRRPTAFAAVPALLGSRPVTTPRAATRRAKPWDGRLE
jgi:hypothetical protein